MTASKCPQSADRPDTRLELLLHRLRLRPAGLTDPGLPADPAVVARQVLRGDDLLTRFTTAATTAGASVQSVPAVAASSTVANLLKESGAQMVLLSPLAGSALSAAEAEELERVLAEAGLQTTRSTDADTLFRVDASVTGVSAAVAESGTIVCPSGPGCARGASLIPPIHVALVGRWQLLPDLCDYLASLSADGQLPANLCLISGPSKTADIEGVLVTGVHGPGKLHILVVC
jgi:L-lactate dehydrogenase complex protein LldG